jgi:feruloyl esterase
VKKRVLHPVLSPLVLCALLLTTLAPAQCTRAAEPAAAQSRAAQCAALPAALAGRWPDGSTQLGGAHWIDAGTLRVPGNAWQPPHDIAVPAHCELVGQLQAREGTLGQRYAIRFHLRLPAAWNGRFYFMGGGGSNGELGDALGAGGGGAPSALDQGYAVASQDSGHDNAGNADPAHAGQLVFGFDAQARANYGHASLPLVADAAAAAIRAFYGEPARHSYFVGCSKGGEEAMAIAQRYAGRFDGIAAGAPGMSLPRAALAEAWDTQSFARVLPPHAGRPHGLADLAGAFTEADFQVVAESVLAACDALDGLADGIVADTARCTTRRVLPQLDRRQCHRGQSSGCIATAKMDALLRVMGGPRDPHGKPLYAEWAWDPGIAGMGWRTWKIGAPGAQPPALNVVLGAASLASVFTTPPTPLPGDQQALLQYQLGFDFGRDAPAIYAHGGGFPRSAWEDISARSPDLDALRARGGKLLVWHGVADPVFSVRDTIDWWDEVHARYRGAEQGFVRLFTVPGLNHCGGGPAAGDFDVLAALVRWVEQGEAPAQLAARAGQDTPWPGRTRPLCSWPAVARYKGQGDIGQAGSFECRK